jgi:hypothetical protein
MNSNVRRLRASPWVAAYNLRHASDYSATMLGCRLQDPRLRGSRASHYWRERSPTSGPLIAKSISIKGAGCKSGGCALKAVELTSGGLLYVPESK